MIENLYKRRSVSLPLFTILALSPMVASRAEADSPGRHLRWRAPLLEQPVAAPKIEPAPKLPPKQIPREPAPAPVPARQKLPDNYNNAPALRGEIAQEREPDGRLLSEREVTKGKSGRYESNGHFHYFTSEDRLTAIGRYVNGLREGTWRRIYDEDTTELFSVAPYKEFEGPYHSTAEFKNGKLNGLWEITDCYGTLISRIQFRDGLRHGHTVWNHPSGERMYSANYRDGLLEGLVEEFAVNGMQISGHEFFGGRRLETDVEYYDGGSVKREADFLSKIQKLKYRDDWWDARLATYAASGERLQHGRLLEFYADGKRMTDGSYLNNVLSGDFQSWYENGQRKSLGAFKGGEYQGRWTLWYMNGNKQSEGAFQDGARVGEWVHWEEDGSLQRAVAVQPPAQKASPKQVKRVQPRRRHHQARRPTILELLLN